MLGDSGDGRCGEDFGEGARAMAIGGGEAGDDAPGDLVVAEELDDDFAIQFATRLAEHGVQIAQGHADARGEGAVAQ